jgi:hypothetical protein
MIHADRRPPTMCSRFPCFQSIGVCIIISAQVGTLKLCPQMAISMTVSVRRRRIPCRRSDSRGPASPSRQAGDNQDYRYRALCGYEDCVSHMVTLGRNPLSWASAARCNGIRDPSAVLDRIVLTKLLPKMHGTRSRLEKPLTELLHFAQRADESSQVYLPSTASKATRMLTVLWDAQFVSFTE